MDKKKKIFGKDAHNWVGGTKIWRATYCEVRDMAAALQADGEHLAAGELLAMPEVGGQELRSCGTVRVVENGEPGHARQYYYNLPDIREYLLAKLQAKLLAENEAQNA